MLAICIVWGLTVWYYWKKIVPGKMYYVGKTYTDPETRPFSNHLFKTRSGKKDHTYNYVVVGLLDKIGEVPAGTILLFDELKEPKVGDLCLFEHDKKMRVAICTHNGKLRYEPDLFDGHETPGIGYELIGVAKYAA